MRYIKMDTKLKTNILRLFGLGYNYSQIIKELKCSRAVVSYHCSKLRINKYTKEKIEVYQDFYNKCRNITKTAINFNLCRKTLAKHLNNNHPNKVKLPHKRLRLNSYYRNVKIKAVEYLGGKCMVCGYLKSTWSLDFHHKDPFEKEFVISGGTRSFESIKNELDKCILLCRNCHGEEHERLFNEKILAYSR